MGLRVFGGGLMIISKYPIETTRELAFDKGVASDGFVTKGILYAKVNIGSSYVHVFNTHMQASYGYEFKEHDPYALIRRKQIEQIASFVAKLTLDDDHPILIMGDFNVNAIRHPEHGGETREYQEMLETLTSNGIFRVIDLHLEFHGAHPVTNSGRGVIGKKSAGGQRLDFVFEMRRNYTRNHRVLHKFPHCGVETFEVQGEAYTHISDHYGSHVVMELLNKEEENKDEGEGKEEKEREKEKEKKKAAKKGKKKAAKKEKKKAAKDAADAPVRKTITVAFAE